MKLIQEFQHENVPRISDRKILFEYFGIILQCYACLEWFLLEKFFERLNLDFE